MKNLKVYISILVFIFTSFTAFSQLEGNAYTCKITNNNPNSLAELNVRRPGECMFVVAGDFSTWRYDGTLTLGARWVAATTETDPFAWKLVGNTVSGSDAIGTNNATSLKFKVNTARVGEFLTDGKFGIGTTSPTHGLTVNGVGDMAVYGVFSPKSILGKSLTLGQYGQFEFNGDFNIYRFGHSNSINAGFYNFNMFPNNKITVNGSAQYGDVTLNALTSGKTIPAPGTLDGDFVITGLSGGLGALSQGITTGGDAYLQALPVSGSSPKQLVLQRQGGKTLVGVQTSTDGDAIVEIGKTGAGAMGGYMTLRNESPSATNNATGIGFKIGSEFVSGFSSAQIIAQSIGGFDTDLIFRTYNGSPVNVAQMKSTGVLNVLNGYQVGGAATLGNVLRGNGTNFVSAKLLPSDLEQQSATTNQILEWNGTIWAPVTRPTGLTGVGAFQTSENSTGLSISGTDVRLHAAGFNGVGGINQTAQILNAGTARKTITSNSASGAGSVNFDNEDATKTAGFQFTEALGTVVLGNMYATGNATSSNVIISNVVATVVKEMVRYVGQSNTTIYSGATTYTTPAAITTSYDATNVTNKSTSYNLSDGAALNLEDPTTLDNGTIVSFTATNLTTNATINTPSGTDDFWNNGASSASAILTITSGTVKTGKCEVHSVGGTKYWIVTIY